jgi:hypothetical protein
MRRGATEREARTVFARVDEKMRGIERLPSGGKAARRTPERRSAATGFTFSCDRHNLFKENRRVNAGERHDSQTDL